MKNEQGKAYGILIAVLLILWIVGLLQLLAGVIGGTLIVLALFATIEKIPGFWLIATNPIGKLIVLGGTAWLTHAAFGADTIFGMIALAWSVLFKVMIIEAKTRELKPWKA